MSNRILHIDKLKKTYPGYNKQVISGLDLTINDREIYGFLGPNGAGKTTTVNIISGLITPDSGNVSLFERDYITDKKYIKQHLGIVPQNIALFPELTAVENLKIFGNIYGITNAELKKRINDFLELYGLSEYADKRVSTFSGGMKRSINLIIGVLHQPDFLILDEPTVGIDVQSKKIIIDSLVEMNKKGMTILYTSHDMEEAESLCSKVGIIDNGRLIAEDTPQKLITSYPNCHELEDVYLHLTGRKLRNI